MALPQADPSTLLGPQSYAPPQMTQALPSGPTVGGSWTGGFDVADLVNRLTPQSLVTPADIKAAITPIAQQGPISVPSSFGYRTPNPPPAMIDTSERIGKSAARSQGIGNAISATVGALAQFKATRDQHKQEADATRVSRLVEAQNAVMQAQQVLKTDPNNADAKKALQDNNSIIQGMFQDPKFVKTVEKGFQISMTDPSQNKTPDHGVVQRGLDMFRQRQGQQVSAQEAMRRFQSATPTQMAANQQAIAALQTKMAQDKQQIELTKAYLPAAIRGEYQARAIEATSNRMKEIAQFNQDSQNSRELARIAAKNAEDYKQYVRQKDLAGYRSSLALGRALSILGSKGVTNDKLQQQQNEYNQGSQTHIQATQNEIDNLTRDMMAQPNYAQVARPNFATDKEYQDAISKYPLIKQMQDRIDQRTKDLNDYKNENKIVNQQFYDRIQGKVQLDAPGTQQPTSGQPGATGGNIQPAATGGSPISESIGTGDYQQIANLLSTGTLSDTGEGEDSTGNE